MPHPPPSKRAKTETSPHAEEATATSVDKEALAGVDGALSGCAADLSTDLIGRVSTFASISNANVLNICLAVGRPTGAAIIRRSYLQNNDAFLCHSLEEYLTKGGHRENSSSKKKCCDNIRAWMNINTDWKTQCCTAKNMEKLKMASWTEIVDSNGSNPDYAEDEYSLHPYIAFNNPSVAIELGLNEALKFLVEEKKVSVNAYEWTNYSYGKNKYHLLSVAVLENNIDAFRYLLSRDDIDLKSLVHDEAGEEDCLIVLLLQADNEFSIDFLKYFVEHPSFDPNASVFWEGITPLQFAVVELSLLNNGAKEVADSIPKYLKLLDLWFVRFKLLLEIGGDPHLETEAAMSPIALVKRKIHDAVAGSAVWKSVLKVMQD